ncbi:MAG TPA: STAS domain-containing protein [bacterium]|nr:STAS domain-containing protein [bacterium]
MLINIIETDAEAVVKLKGELDYNSYKNFEEKIIGIIETGTKRVIIEMSELIHIDSMGLGTLTKLWRMADEEGGLLVLVGVPSNIEKMIKLVNLDGRIGIFATEEEAKK